MRYGQISLEREQSARLLGWGIRFFLAAALTASQTPGGYAPFALGCVAAAGPGADGAAALVGAGVGALLFLDFADALPFLATGILILTAATAFQGSRLLAGKRVLPLTAAGRELLLSALRATGMPGADVCAALDALRGRAAVMLRAGDRSGMRESGAVLAQWCRMKEDAQ